MWYDIMRRWYRQAEMRELPGCSMTTKTAGNRRHVDQATNINIWGQLSDRAVSDSLSANDKDLQ